ncbi:MAG TPA: RHS repeat-associated core domain-containing protein [Pyrinomonadaceae bacterium]|nr:RHS repeat-associated core domain-containing protein [Pyrinomonadaceae bacterium]
MFSSSSPKSLRFSAQLVAKTVNGRSLTKLLPRILLLVSLQVVLVTLAHAQITLSGRVMYSAGDPAVGASVKMTKTIFNVSPQVVTTETTIADSGGNYSFEIESGCSADYEVRATSSEIVDDEPLPPSNRSATGGCVTSSVVLGNLIIVRPSVIVLGGVVRDQSGTPVQGLTVTMTRTKSDLNPPVTSTATTTTDAGGHYQFTTYSRCSVDEVFKASLNGSVFQGGTATGGCVLTSNDLLNFPISTNTLENAGQAPCNHTVGAPVNVTNGNMYLRQMDYQLPGVGEAIGISRTYNSTSQSIGLFGRGWTVAYDERVTLDANGRLQLMLPDGRLVTFATPNFFGQIVRNGDGSYTAVFKDGRVHQFNASGKLISLADRNANQTLLTYDMNGRLSSVTDSFGRVLTVTSSSSGLVLSISDSLGAIASYTYGGSNELLTVTYPDNSGYRFTYTGVPSGLALATVSDALGNAIEQHDYDSQGRATTSQAQSGVEHYTLNYINSTETDVTDALGRVTKYFYHNVKGRKAVTGVEGLCSCGGSQAQTWTYDDQMNVISHTNALGQAATYTYDANGNEVTGTGVLGSSSFTYNQFGEVLTATDAMDGLTTNTYDAAGNLLSATDALNKATTLTYDTRGELLTLTNAHGKVTTLAYDSRGNISQTTDALANVTRFAYDARGRVTTATDVLNNITSYGYDLAGRLNKITRPDNSIITLTYDLAGRPTKVTDPLGNINSFAYDSAYRLTGETDALSKSVSYSYDLMSNLIGATDQLGHTTNVVYDEFNRPKTVTYPPAVAGGTRLQETTEYDAAGNVTKRTDTAGRVTTLEYDNANRLVKVTDPAQQTTQYEYNARSNVIAVVDGLNQRYAFDYDALGRVTAVTRAGMMMTVDYDAVGNRIQRTDFNNLMTNYAYDALNRLTKITYPDGSTATYAYDQLSRLTAAANINGTVGFVYDKLGRVTSTTDVWGQLINYTYDANGRRTKMSFGSSTFATYTYDALNRLTKITDGANQATSYAYDVTGKVTSRTLPNSVVTTYGYDGLGRVTQLKDAKKNTVITANQYSYNSASEIIQNIDQSGTHAYGYDVLDRLTSATYTGTAAESYTYDGVGNRMSSQRSATYSYQPFNRLTGTSTAGYLYDNNGNMTTKTEGASTTHFAWDFENRLTQVVTPTAGSVSYKYDALGRRVQSAPSTGVSTNFTYDGDDVARDRTSTNVITEYLSGPGLDNKIRQKTVNTLYYFAQDHLGSTTALTDSKGALVEREAYDAYGNSTGSAKTRYGFTGRERDSVTGLIYYRARWYEPQLGRFISEDPIGLAGGINSFAYVGNNPQNATDPTGLYEIDVHYYLTYYLAKKTGCFQDWEAREIANEDQLTDENAETRPARGSTDMQRMRNRVFHGFFSGAREGVGSPLLWAGAMNEKSGHKWIGRYLHYLQDTFSHAGYTDDVWGHSPANVGNGKYGDHATDKTAEDPSKAQRMIAAVWQALIEYGKAKHCDCAPRWDDSMWRTLNAFINVATDDPRWSTIDANRRAMDNPGLGDPAALAIKRRILGLRNRDTGAW